MRLTIICPAALCDSANQLALVLGQSTADAQTFDLAGGSGIGGGTLALASISDGATWLAAMAALPYRPDWDVSGAIDMSAAEAARQCLQDWSGTGPLPSTEDAILLVTQVDSLALARHLITELGA